MIVPDKIELIPVGDLIPYVQNARTHTPEQIEQIAASIDEFGWTNPVLVNASGGIIAGHGRVMAAKLRGIIDIPCVRIAHLNPEQERALILADNKLALNAGWDDELLRSEIEALQDMDFDLGAMGFSEAELDEIIAGGKPNDRDPDADAPEPPDDPVSQLGQIWQLGRHRIACGDSTSAETVAALLGDEKPHLMVTDPPYGVEYDANWRNEADRANGKPYGARAVGKVENDERADWTEAWKLFPGDVAYVWHAGRHASAVQVSLEAAGFVLRSQIIWAKDRLIISRGDYHWQHEPCWYAVRKGRTGHWSGDRKQTTLWEISHMKSETGHSTQKPVECMRRPIENNSKPGDAIYEPFSGSGTTIIAGEMTGRRVFAIELNPAYVDVAVRRWQDYSGKQAILEQDGRTFEAVAAASRD